MSDLGEITGLLHQLETSEGAEQQRVLDSLIPLVYSHLKHLAHSNRYRWHGASAHGTTSLVHEAYAKLARGQPIGYDSRGQYFAVASKAMRSILIDNARWHGRSKRGGSDVHVPTETLDLVSVERSAELLALDDALSALEESRPGLARIVECRVFGGLTIEETAEALAISAATVKRRWSLAKSWLYRELQSPA